MAKFYSVHMTSLPSRNVRLLLSLGIVMLLFTYRSEGQQQVMFTQYMFNGTAINPAMVGSHETLSFTALAREQWIGIEGAPSTQTFSLHAPLTKDKIALGALFMRDQIGVSTQNTFFAAYAYRINFDKGTLSMGLQAGFSDYRSNLVGLNPNNQNSIDQSIGNNLTGSFLPNVGTGVYYYARRFYAGFSVPLLLNNFIDEDFGDIDAVVNRPDLERHYFGMFGFVFDLGPKMKVRPSTLIKMVDGAPVNVDLNVSFLFDEVIWFGLSYRSLESLSALIELQATKKFKLGYAYDFTVNNLNNFTTGSHELMLNYRFSFERDRIITPRYF